MESDYGVLKRVSVVEAGEMIHYDVYKSGSRAFSFFNASDETASEPL